MSKKVLETDFPLMVPPNPPLSVHPRFVEHGRNGSLKRAYSSEELAPLHSPSSSDTSDYLSDHPEYLLQPSEQHPQQDHLVKHPPFRPPTHRHRRSEDEEMSGAARCCFGFLFMTTQVLLHGLVTLVLYWVVQFRWDGQGIPFAWRGPTRVDLEKQWNLHPVLMMMGLIYCMGQAMLVYRSCHCCRRIYTKLLHTFFHILAIPCVVLGFMATWDYHSLRKDKEGNPDSIPHFYSIHSWLGLLTMGLFIIQFLVGIFSFLLLLCCESSTARYRAALVPIHSTVGTTTFLLAVATAVAGITEKAFFQLSVTYPGWVEYVQGVPTESLPSIGDIKYSEQHFLESVLLNVMGATLAFLGILMPLMLWAPQFRQKSEKPL